LPVAHRVRGQQVCQLSEVLTDADLFRRLRARGEARGPAGIDDFRKALDLVSGRPYDQQRPNGYGWLVDAPVDHYATAAIADVAPVYATHSLADGRPSQALWAARRQSRQRRTRTGPGSTMHGPGTRWVTTLAHRTACATGCSIARTTTGRRSTLRLVRSRSSSGWIVKALQGRQLRSRANDAILSLEPDRPSSIPACCDALR